ncbi:MAG: DUF2760 domain-containing protein [Candidatus Xenobium sp.]|jgi:hypothetical protein|nr:DUF2760 domain-containing protein [Burkholderiales bacterium]
MRIGLAFKAFFRIFSDQGFAQAVEALLAGDGPAEPPPEKPAVDPAAVQILGLLQREGRLVDFLQEDLEGASDAQLGAVVRTTVYEGCRRAFKEYLDLVPVLDSSEGETVTVESGFDASAIRLIGRVEGDPPFQGVLRHPGWRLKTARLPVPPEGSDDSVISPAEVEIQ